MEALKKYILARPNAETIHIMPHSIVKMGARVTICGLIINGKDTFRAVDAMIPAGKICLHCAAEAMKRVLRHKQPFFRALLTYLIIFETKD